MSSYKKKKNLFIKFCEWINHSRTCIVVTMHRALNHTCTWQYMQFFIPHFSKMLKKYFLVTTCYCYTHSGMINRILDAYPTRVILSTKKHSSHTELMVLRIWSKCVEKNYLIIDLLQWNLMRDATQSKIHLELYH